MSGQETQPTIGQREKRTIKHSSVMLLGRANLWGNVHNVGAAVLTGNDPTPEPHWPMAANRHQERSLLLRKYIDADVLGIYRIGQEKTSDNTQLKIV